MKRLNNIELLLPVKTKEENQFYNDFMSFLSNIPNSFRNKKTVSFSPKFPYRSCPITTIGYSGTNQIQIKFLQYKKNEIELNDTPIKKIFTIINKRTITEVSKHTLEISQLDNIFREKFLRLDHIGLNIPPTLVTKSEYQNFVTSLGNTCTFHHYPTGKDWDFILPSSRSEWENGISDYRLGREPKWEFVYDEYTKIPVVQLCIETKLTKKDVFNLLPDPYGISYDGLKSAFRTVFITIPWNNLRIRCDIKFYSKNRENTWNTGEWLGTRGKRIGNFK